MIIGTKISTSLFHYDKESKKFTQEISSLGNCSTELNSILTGRLYDDACDEGFVLVSEKTGAEVPFYLVDVETNEGDILCWNFKSALTDTDHENLTVTIFND